MRTDEIRACVRCGSADLRIPGLSDGVIVGEAQDLARWACDSCGLTAIPLLFDDEAAYAAYAKERASDLANDRPPRPKA